MKKIALIISMLTVSFLASNAHAQYTSRGNSPNNFNNSNNNFANSPNNFKNSPNNYQNSQYNPNSKGIYDSQGNRQGYAVPKASGGTNIYDNNGNRIGYSN